MVLRAGDLSVDQLMVLVEVVEAGSFTAAARAHRRTQGAVSYHVARLEALIELELFDRSGHRPRLTEKGGAVLRHARRVLAELDQLVATASSLRSGHEASLRVCVDVLLPPYRIAAMLTAFETRFPHVDLGVSTGVWTQPVEALREGRAHLAVAAHPAGRGLRAAVIAEVEFVPVVAPSHPLAECSEAVTPEVLGRHRRLVLSTEVNLPEDTEGAPEGVWRLDNAATRRGLLLEGVGWARMPRWQVQSDLREGRLVALALRGWHGPSRLELAVMADPAVGLGPAASWLYDHLCETGTAGSSA